MKGRIRSACGSSDGGALTIETGVFVADEHYVAARLLEHAGPYACRSASGELPRPAGGTETILLAEDEPSVRSLLKTVLGDAGYTVIEAADGEAALDAFRRHASEIKLALLDVIMPKRNGRDVSEEIRRIARRGRLDAGIKLIVKPADPAIFLASVRSALDDR